MSQRQYSSPVQQVEIGMTRSSDPSYDDVLYPQKSHANAHIARLESLATLFDMRPTAITECRVLELGCAAGWNLIPQAFDYPESEFIGVDASSRQIAAGGPLIKSLGLENIELRQADILNIDDSWGKFDYVLCHGVYSWVPPEVQQHIMRICKENLAPEGVAHVSYNVLPGWHFRGITREMMLYHAAQFEQPEEQLSQARAVLDFMADNCPQDTAYGQMLADELAIVKEAEDAYLFHDHLEDNNHPIYFHEFCRRAESVGLQYLSDVRFADMLPRHLPQPVQQALDNASLVKQEQYMDFLLNNSFRQTLLCHASMPLKRQLHASTLETFHLVLASKTKPGIPDFPIGSNASVQFSIEKRTIETSAPTSKAALHELVARWPQTVTIDDLQVAIQERLAAAGVPCQKSPQELRDELAGGMMELVATGLMDFFAHPPELYTSSHDRPEVSALARQQAKLGSNVTSAYHRNIRLDAATREFVSRLDGTTDREELVTSFASDVLRAMSAAKNSLGGDDSTLNDGESGQPPVALAELPVAAEQIRQALKTLTDAGLVVEA